jgi:hypothetical protein
MVQLASLLMASRGQVQLTKDFDIDNTEPLGLPEGTYTFITEYRPNDPKGTVPHVLKPETTAYDILLLGALDFETILGIKDPSTGHAVLIPIDLADCPHIKIKNHLFGKTPEEIELGLLTDPGLEGIEIDTRKMTVSFAMGT